MKEALQGRGSGAVRELAVNGETTGETDEFGLPVRYDWAAEYRGRAAVVVEWQNRTVCVDTGASSTGEGGGGRAIARRA